MLRNVPVFGTVCQQYNTMHFRNAWSHKICVYISYEWIIPSSVYAQWMHLRIWQPIRNVQLSIDLKLPDFGSSLHRLFEAKKPKTPLPFSSKALV